MRDRKLLGVVTSIACAVGVGSASAQAAQTNVVETGNDKVSLTLSGWLSQQAMWWNDGDLWDTYVLDQGTTLASHTTFTGSGKIDEDWSTGLQLRLEWSSVSSFAVSQTSSVPGLGVSPLTIFWWVKSETFGQISLGKVSQASDNAAILADVSGLNLITANWVPFDGLAFAVRPTGGPGGEAGLAAATWGRFITCHHINAGIGADCNGVPRQALKYDSPSLAGFSLSASVGPDDFWDVAARYANTLGDFNVSAQAAFSRDTTESGGALDVDVEESDYFQAGAGVKHVPTGIFAYGAYGIEMNDTTFEADVRGRTKLPDGVHWYVKAGVQNKWYDLGALTLWGELGAHDDMALAGFSNTAIGDRSCDAFVGSCDDTTTITDSRMAKFGAGIQQDIDAVAASFYAKYRHHSLDVSFADSGGAVALEFEPIDMVVAGGIFHF